jgi:hypothetical protein
MVQRLPDYTSPIPWIVSNKWSIYCSCEIALATFAANEMTMAGFVLPGCWARPGFSWAGPSAYLADSRLRAFIFGNFEVASPLN